MSSDVGKFYDSLVSQFGNPRMPDGIDENLFLQQFKEDLAGFSEEVYNLAAKKLRTDRNSMRFPRPNGKILAVCEDFRDQLSGASKARANLAAVAAVPASNRRTAQQLVLDNLELARDAAQEGWIHGLWDFCRVNQRGPFGDAEIQQCKDDASEFKRSRIKTPRPDADKREQRLIALVMGNAA